MVRGSRNSYLSQGQANHFFRYAPEKIEYGINRYQNETRRLYGVLDKHLEKSSSGYIVGDKCTIADIAHWGWVAASGWAGIDLNEFKSLKVWEEKLLKRPAFAKGENVPEPNKLRQVANDPDAAAKEAANQSKWIMEGQKRDSSK